MPFRLLEYMTRLWRRHIQDIGKKSKAKNYKLPAILPVIFYDGEQKSGWTAEQQYLNKVQHRDVFKDYTPRFEYILVDLTVISVEELERLKNPNSLIMLLDKLRTPEGLQRFRELSDEYWETVVKLAKRNGLMELLKEIVYIIMKNNHVNDDLIEETMERLKKGEVKEGMLIYSEGLDVLKAEERGEKRGEAKLLWNLIKKKFPAVEDSYYEKIKALDEEKIETISLALLDMTDSKELEQYL